MQALSQTAILPNGLLAVALGLYVLWDLRSPSVPVAGAVLTATLVYCTLHFSFGAWIVLTDPNARFVLADMHGRTLSEGARNWGAAFMLFVLGVLAWRYGNETRTWLRQPDRRTLLLVVAACGAALLAGLALVFLGGNLTPLAPKDVASMLAMLVLALLLTAAWTAEGPDEREEALQHLLRVVAALAALVVVVALFELNTGRTRAFTPLPDGAVAERASSLLFDPNLLGMWCAGAAVFAGRFFSRPGEPGDRKWAAAVLVLAGIGLLCSGSRSGLILYLCMVAVVLVHRFHHNGRRGLPGALRPVALTIGGFALSGALASALAWLLPAVPRTVTALAILLERMARLPLDLGGYLLSLVAPRAGDGSQGAPGEAAGDFDATEMSVEGRFEGTVPDNGYLATLDAAGPLGLAALIGILLFGALLTLRRVWPRPDADAGYVLAAGFGCALSAVFLRTFTVFPLWVFVAFGIVVVLASVLTPKRPVGEGWSSGGDRTPRKGRRLDRETPME